MRDKVYLQGLEVVILRYKMLAKQSVYRHARHATPCNNTSPTCITANSHVALRMLMSLPSPRPGVPGVPQPGEGVQARPVRLVRAVPQQTRVSGAPGAARPVGRHASLRRPRQVGLAAHHNNVV